MFCPEFQIDGDFELSSIARWRNSQRLIIRPLASRAILLSFARIREFAFRLLHIDNGFFENVSKIGVQCLCHSEQRIECWVPRCFLETAYQRLAQASLFCESIHGKTALRPFLTQEAGDFRLDLIQRRILFHPKSIRR